MYNSNLVCWYHTGISTVAENPMLIAVIHEILDMPHFVVDRNEIFLRDCRTHFDAVFRKKEKTKTNGSLSWDSQ